MSATVAAELRKLPAFLRRDFLTAWSYRSYFVFEWLGLFFQALLFYFVGRIVDESSLPRFGGDEVTYLEFVAVGIALGTYIDTLLGQAANSIREEQFMGTLESVLSTSTRVTTLQLGSILYPLVLIPIRTAIFLAVIAFGFDLSFRPDGVLPALAVLVAFSPFVWGLGVATAAGTLTFRRGSGGVASVISLLVLASGAYFPLAVLPDWLEPLAEHNPIGVALQATREALLGGGGWAVVEEDLFLLSATSIVFVALGMVAFRLALARERRRGTLGVY